MEKFYGITRLITLTLVILLIIMYYNFYDTVNNKVDEAVKRYTQTVEKYLSEIIEMDIKRNETLFEYLESVFDNKKNFNIEEVSYEIKEFNLLYPNESKSFFIFNDGTYIISDGQVNSYFETRNLLQENFYKETVENYKFTIIPYSEYNSDKNYMFTRPILNDKGEFLGILGRMCEIKWLISQIANGNQKINADIVFETKDEKLLTVIKTNGDIYEGAIEEYYNEANKIKQNSKVHKYVNDEIGINIYILPQEKLIKNTYNIVRVSSNLMSFIICMVIIFMIVKMSDMRIINIILFVILISFYMLGYNSFKNVYLDIEAMSMQLKYGTYEEKLNMRAENTLLNLEYISSKIYEGMIARINKFNIKVKSISEAKASLIAQSPRDKYHKLIELLNYNCPLYIMFDDNTKLNLSTFEVLPFEDVDEYLYKKCIENNTAYYNNVFKNNSTNNTIATNMCKINIIDDKMLVLASKGDFLSEFVYNIVDIVNNQNFSDGYLVDFTSSKNEIYKIRGNKYEVMSLKNKLETEEIEYKIIADHLSQIKDTKKSIFDYEITDNNGKTRTCVIYKKDELKQLIISYVDYEDLYIVKNIVKKYMWFAFVILSFVTILEIFIIVVLKIKRKQREDVVLHNNY